MYCGSLLYLEENPDSRMNSVESVVSSSDVNRFIGEDL